MADSPSTPAIGVSVPVGFATDPAYHPDLGRFYAESERAALVYRREQQWESDVERMEWSGAPIFSQQNAHDGSWVGYLDRVLIRIRYGSGSVHVLMAGTCAEDLEAALESLREMFPAPPPGQSNEVPITFWYHTSQGPQSVRRRLTVPRWDEIGPNYPAEVRRHLAGLATATEPQGGRLILWTGPAGTGKTWAIRMLASEWREWVDVHYLIDPERFFGDYASDLMQVVLGAGDSKVPEGEPTPAKKAERWILLVLEDSGEMLAADAKDHVGQGLSRLLNLVDGLLGQGLRVMALITSNEEMGKMHPAVTRPGRCWDSVVFDQLSAEEAEDWRQRNEVAGATSGAAYLADLYAESAERVNRSQQRARAIGFGRE